MSPIARRTSARPVGSAGGRGVAGSNVGTFLQRARSGCGCSTRANAADRAVAAQGGLASLRRPSWRARGTLIWPNLSTADEMRRRPRRSSSHYKTIDSVGLRTSDRINAPSRGIGHALSNSGSSTFSHCRLFPLEYRLPARFETIPPGPARRPWRTRALPRPPWSH
jgi:hypothetical protein